MLQKIDNVLVLMCDQLRYDAIAAHGNPYVHTPNIDRLAQRSVRFTQAFCNSPVCGPTRHSLATGQYPYRHGVINNTLLPRDGMRTIAHRLRDHGYRTGCFGHMHWQRIEAHDGRDNAFPDHGYEVYDAISHDTTDLTAAQKERLLWEQTSLTQQCTAGASVVDEAHCYSRQIADASIQRLKEWAGRGEGLTENDASGEASPRAERFLAWVSFNDPHPPFFPPAELYAKYAAMDLPLPHHRPTDALPPQSEISGDSVWSRMTPLDHRVMKAGYYGLVELADRHLGRVLDTLDELDLWKNTVILFTVDHGELLGDHGRYFKSVMWESAVHMPFFVYHPDVEPGDCSALVEHVDVFPTVCELLQLPIPDTVQGRSLVPLLNGGEPGKPWREVVLTQLDDDIMLRTEQWKLVYRDGAPQCLFDLSADPDEVYDCLAAQPDVVASLQLWLAENHPQLFEENRIVRASGRVRKKKCKPKVQLVEVS